jgi:hypothetical protein
VRTSRKHRAPGDRSGPNLRLLDAHTMVLAAMMEVYNALKANGADDLSADTRAILASTLEEAMQAAIDAYNGDRRKLDAMRVRFGLPRLGQIVEGDDDAR